MAKAKILNLNGYIGAELIKGRVVSCDILNHLDSGDAIGIKVTGHELIKVGAEARFFDCDWVYTIPIKCVEIIEE